MSRRSPRAESLADFWKFGAAADVPRHHRAGGLTGDLRTPDGGLFLARATAVETARPIDNWHPGLEAATWAAATRPSGPWPENLPGHEPNHYPAIEEDYDRTLPPPTRSGLGLGLLLAGVAVIVLVVLVCIVGGGTE